MTLRLSLQPCVLAPLALLAGCGGGEDEAATTATVPTAGDQPPARTRPSALVSLPTSAASTTARSTPSRTRASSARKSSWGSSGRVLVSRANADYVPNLSRLAKEGYDLVIAVGFLMADAVDTVAPEVPRRRLRDRRRGPAGAEVEAAERPRPALRGGGGRLNRRLPRGARDEARGRLEAGDRVGRRHEDPALSTGTSPATGLGGGRRIRRS